MLTKRQASILKMISSQPGIHGNELSRALNVTSRTIRSEVACINDIAKVMLICANPKSGYTIDLKYTSIATELLAQDKSLLSMQESRMYMILGNVLFSDECSLDELSELMSLSKSALRKEIFRLFGYLDHTFNTQVFELRKDKCIVVINESEIRKVLFQIVKYQATNNIGVLKETLNILLCQSSLLNDFNDVKKLIQSTLFSRSIQLKEYDLIVFTACIIIVRTRNLFGYAIEQEEVLDLPFYEDFKKIFGQIMDECTYLRSIDSALLYQLFYTFKFRYEKVQFPVTDFSQVLFDEFCKEVFDKYSLDLKESEEVRKNILVHVEYMTRRVLGRYELKNPILDEIKRKFSYAFEISMMIVPIMFKYKKIYISEDEISYIAVHVAHFLENVNYKLKTILVMNQRHSVKNIVSKWFKDYFENQIEVVSMVHSFEISRVDLSKIDLIIFVNDFVPIANIQTYSIMGLPDLKDIEKLNKVIHRVRLKKRVYSLLNRYIQEQAVHVYKEKVSIQSLFADASKRLYDRDIIENEGEFYQDLIQREKNYPTYLGTGVMLPHTLFTFAKTTGIDISLLSQPLLCDGHEVKLVFTLAFEKGKNDDMDMLLSFFNQVVLFPSYINRLSDSKTSKEFLDNLYDFKLLE